MSTKIFSPGCESLVYALFLTARDFALEHAQTFQNHSVSINYTPRVLYVVRDNFSPRCEYLCNTLISISLDRPNFLRHYYFSSLVSILFSGISVSASYPSGRYIFALK